MGSGADGRHRARRDLGGRGEYRGARGAWARDVRLGADCRIGPGVVLEDGVVVGDDCDIGPNTVCHRGTRLGNRVRLKAAAVIGGDGFGFASGPDGHRPIRHVGGCILEDDVAGRLPLRDRPRQPR